MHRNRAAVVRLALFGAAVAALFVFATASGRLPSANDIRDWGDGLGALGPVLFVPASVALGCALTPGPVLAGAAGLLFGTAAVALALGQCIERRPLPQASQVKKASDCGCVRHRGCGRLPVWTTIS